MKTYRDHFHMPKGIYLLCHSVGPLTTRAEDYLEDKYLTPLREQGGGAWPGWLGVLDGFCESLAKLLGGAAQDYCPQANLSSGLTKYLTALPSPGRRNTVLMHAHAFPTMGFVVSALQSRGYELNLIPADLDAADAQVWAGAIDDRTAAILITHVHSNTGVLSPVAEIAKIAKAQDVRILVDIAQSAGIIPIHIPDWNVDAVFGSCVKWLCGGPGAGYIWVNPRSILDLEPEDVGWFSHENPFEFDITHFKYASNAKRFLGGTPSVAPYALAQGSIETILDIGVDTIRAHNVELMKTLKPDIKLHRNGGTLCIDLGERADAIEQKLTTAKCHFDRRGTVFRLSPHIYNSRDQIADIAGIIT